MIVILVCCNQKISTKPSFDLIDVTIFDGWTDIYCLKVYNDGQIYILNNSLHQRDKYFRINIGREELDSISSLVNIVLNQSIDTLYEARCRDCGSYNIIIKSFNKTLHSYVIGIDNNNQIPVLNQLAIYLYHLADFANTKIDSVFVFESRKEGFYPPPPPWDSTIKY
jgi:hypothetical protein